MKYILGGFVFIIFFVGLGVTLSANAMQIATRGDQTEWESVILPPGYVPDYFIIGEGPYVYVSTTDGTTLIQLHRMDQIFPWEIFEDKPLEGDPFYTHARADCSLATNEIEEECMPKPPGKIKEQVICDYMRHVEYSGVIRYVLLDHKGIWRWAKTDLGKAGF